MGIKTTNTSEQAVINGASCEYLNATDWYVLRNQESGEAVPASVTAARASARIAIVE